jgi:parallel beta-helix repeat protein
MILGGTGNRIIRNKISSSGRGVYVTGSFANLIWKNQIEDVFDGVLLITASTNHWVIENEAARTVDDGFEAFLTGDQNNAFIGNMARNCGGNCFEIFGRNCLAYHNVAIEGSIDGYLIAAGDNSVAIENRAVKCGDGVRVLSQNTFLALNELKNNNGSGLEILTDFNIALWNHIAFNLDSGLVLGAESNGNFIYKNRVECNTPFDIVAGGTDNNLLRNITGCREDCRS